MELDIGGAAAFGVVGQVANARPCRAVTPVAWARLGERSLDQTWASPPSTKSSAPVMKLASSEARKTAALAISSGSPEDGLRLSGPAVTVPAPTAQTLSLVLHELATNAAKYGALSVPEGRAELAWRVEAVPEEGRRLTLEWAERGGPEVRPPERRGFGRSLIERSAAYELDGMARLEFPPEGVRCRIELPLTSRG